MFFLYLYMFRLISPSSLEVSTVVGVTLSLTFSTFFLEAREMIGEELMQPSSLSHLSFLSCLRGLGLSITVVLLLAFVERPSSLSVSSDPRYRSQPWEPPCGFTESIEMICLIIFSVDLAVKVRTSRVTSVWRTGLPHELYALCFQLHLWRSVCSVSRATWLAGMNSGRANGWLATLWSSQSPSLTGCCLSVWCVMR